MRVLLNRETFEAALPHMPVATVVPMIAADVAGHPPLHERAEGSVGGRLHDQVEMIGHEADAEEFDGVFGFCRGEQVEKCGVVAVLVEDRGATVPTIQHMVGVTSDLSPGNARHGRHSVGDNRVGRQAKSSLSPFLSCPLFCPTLFCPIPFSVPRTRVFLMAT